MSIFITLVITFLVYQKPIVTLTKSLASLPLFFQFVSFNKLSIYQQVYNYEGNRTMSKRINGNGTMCRKHITRVASRHIVRLETPTGNQTVNLAALIDRGRTIVSHSGMRLQDSSRRWSANWPNRTVFPEQQASQKRMSENRALQANDWINDRDPRPSLSRFSIANDSDGGMKHDQLEFKFPCQRSTVPSFPVGETIRKQSAVLILPTNH